MYQPDFGVWQGTGGFHTFHTFEAVPSVKERLERHTVHTFSALPKRWGVSYRSYMQNGDRNFSCM